MRDPSGPPYMWVYLPIAKKKVIILDRIFELNNLTTTLQTLLFNFYFSVIENYFPAGDYVPLFYDEYLTLQITSVFSALY